MTPLAPRSAARPKLTVDPELAALIPPLTDDERAQLERSLVAEGCRDRLVVWQGRGIILDGHNRLTICEAHGLDFGVVRIKLPDRDAAKLWIIRNQLGRRNLTPSQRAMLVERLREPIAAEAKERQREAGRKLFPTSGKAPMHTDRALAEIAGVSRDTIHKGKVVTREADEATRQKVEQGELSLTAAYNTVHPKPSAGERSSPPPDEAPGEPMECEIGDLLHIGRAHREIANAVPGLEATAKRRSAAARDRLADFFESGELERLATLAGYKITDAKRKAVKKAGQFGPKHPAYQIAVALLDAIRSHLPDFKPGFGDRGLQRWAKAADRMLRLDKRTLDDALAVINWCHRCEGDSDAEFWRGNILSVAKLSEKFDQLRIKMRRGSSTGRRRSRTNPKAPPGKYAGVAKQV